MSHAKIRNLFSAKLTEANEAGQLLGREIPIAFDNVTPKVSAEELKSQTNIVTHSIITDTYASSLGGDLVLYEGLYQLTIRVKADETTADADDLIDQLQALFKLDSLLELRDDDDKVTFFAQIVEPLAPASGRRIENWWVVPCTLSYKALTK